MERLIEMQLSAEPQRASTGEVMGVVCVGEDITGRREMEAAKLKSMVLEKSKVLSSFVIHIQPHHQVSQLKLEQRLINLRAVRVMQNLLLEVI